jgi:hypothetical protein
MHWNAFANHAMASEAAGTSSWKGGRSLMRCMAPLLVLPVLICAGLPRGHAQEAPLPPDVQAQLLMNVLSFDRSQKQRLSKGIKVAVLFESSIRSSALIAKGITKALPDAAESIHSRVRVVSMDMKGNGDLVTRLRDLGIRIAYVAPLRPSGVAAVTEACRAQRILTFTGVGKYVRQGAAVGLVRQGGKSQVLINLPASRAAGSVFSAQLLRVARVVE